MNFSDSPPVWQLLNSRQSALLLSLFDLHSHTCVHMYKHWWDSNSGLSVWHIMGSNRLSHHGSAFLDQLLHIIAAPDISWDKRFTSDSIWPSHFYRPHPKDGGRYCFHRCLSVHTQVGYLPWPGPDGWGVTYPGQGRYTPPGQISTANTCCAAGGMPLAFTQEDFLVLFEKKNELVASKSIPWKSSLKSSRMLRRSVMLKHHILAGINDFHLVSQKMHKCS